MHGVDEESKASAGQAPEFPVQLSATSHWPVDGRQVTVEAWKTSTQVSALPLQWSAPSLSQAPPCELPVHDVAADLNTSAGHAPELPVQLSAASHSPVAGRHVTVDALNASMQVLALPLQWSAASSSHAPPCELPVHDVAADLKRSAGHAPELPVQLSATSHWPADGRQVTVEVLKTSTQLSALPLQ